MADNVYLDVLPRFDWAASEAGTKKLVGQFDEAAKTIARTFGVNVGESAKRSTDQIAADVRQMQAEVSRSTNQASSDYGRMVQSLGRVEVAQRRYNEAVAAGSTETSRAASAFTAWASAQTRADAATAAHTRSIEAQTAAQAKLDAASAAQRRTLDQNVAASATAARALNTVGMVAAGGFAASLAVGTKAAGDFQASQERLVTTAGETQDQLNTVSQGLLRMAGQVGESTQQLSAGMYVVESAGFHGADGLKVMQAAAQGARMENADLKDTTNAVTTALHDYHLNADQAANVTSKMITAVSQGKTTLGDFAAGLHSVQPLAAAAGISIDDLYASLAQMTASGMSADQATQNMADAIRHLQAPTQQMSAELAQVGIDSRDLSQHLGDRGLAGSMEMIQRAVIEHMGPAGKVLLDTFNASKQNADAANETFGRLSGRARELAQSVVAGTTTLGDYRKELKQLPLDQATVANQWATLYDKSNGFNQIVKSGGSDVQAYTQALAKATGDASSLNVMLQLTGQNAGKTNADIAAIAASTANADGSVKNWEKTQETFNQQLAQAKAGFEAMAVQIGTAFLPAMTEVARVVGDVAHWLGEHKTIADGLVITLGVLGGAWVAVKTAMGIKSVVDAFTTGIGVMVDASKRGYTAIIGDATTAATAQTTVATDAAAANTALGADRAAASMAGRDAVIAADAASSEAETALAAQAATTDDALLAGGAGAGAKGPGRFARTLRTAGQAVPYLGAAMGIESLESNNPTSEYDPTQHDWRHELFGKLGDWMGGHAAGGPIRGSGMKGRDSVLIAAAPGEHMLTAHEVDLAGGHKGVERLRAGIRAGLIKGYDQGGPIDPTDPLSQILQFKPTPSGSAPVNTPPPAIATGAQWVWDKLSGGVRSVFNDPGRFHKMQIDPNQRGIADQPTPIPPMSRQTFDDLKGNDDNLGALNMIQSGFGPPAPVPANLARGSWFGNKGWPALTGGQPDNSAPASSSSSTGTGNAGDFSDALGATSQMSGYGAADVSAPISGLQLGGNAGQVMSLAQAASKLPYVWGGFGPGGFDCSGLAAALANTATSGDWKSGGRFTTANEGAELAKRGFQPGAGGLGSLTIGWSATHTGITLPDGTHIDAEDTKDGIVMGKGSQGATGFPNVMHLDMPGGAPIAGFNMPGSGAQQPSLTGLGTGTGKGSGQYDPFSQFSGGFNVKNVVGMMTTFLLELAAGNPYGKLRAGQLGGQSGTAALPGVPGAGAPSSAADVATQGYPPSSPQYAPTVQTSVAALANMNEEQLKQLGYQSEEIKTLSRIREDQGKLADQVAKHGANSAQAKDAQITLNSAMVAGQRLQERLGDTASTADARASVEAQRAAGAKTAKGAASAQAAQARDAATAQAASSALGAGPQMPGLNLTTPSIPTAGIGGPADGSGAGLDVSGGLAAPFGGPQLVSPASFAGGQQATYQVPGQSSSTGGHQYAAGQNAGSGFSSSIGSSIMGALGPAAAMVPGGQQAAKLMDRTIGFAGQAAGILASAPLETFLPGGFDNPLADPSKSWFGKLALGVAGAHHDSDNTAGQGVGSPTEPQKPQSSPQGASPAAAPKPGDAQKGHGQSAAGGPVNNGVSIGTFVNQTPNPADGTAAARDLNRYQAGMSR